MTDLSDRIIGSIRTHDDNTRLGVTVGQTEQVLLLEEWENVASFILCCCRAARAPVDSDGSDANTTTAPGGSGQTEGE